MNSQKELHTPEFQSLVKQVEATLAQAAADAQELAERTNTPLITKKIENQEKKD